MMPRVLGGVAAEIAVHFVGFVSLDFHLYRRVIDRESSIEFIDHGLENLLALPNGLLGHKDVATARDGAGADSPDMQVVRSQHARDGRDCLLDLGHVQSQRGSFKKNINAFLKHAPTAPEDQTADEQRNDGIGNG